MYSQSKIIFTVSLFLVILLPLLYSAYLLICFHPSSHYLCIKACSVTEKMKLSGWIGLQKFDCYLLRHKSQDPYNLFMVSFTNIFLCATKTYGLLNGTDIWPFNFQNLHITARHREGGPFCTRDSTLFRLSSIFLHDFSCLYNSD